MILKKIILRSNGGWRPKMASFWPLCLILHFNCIYSMFFARIYLIPHKPTVEANIWPPFFGLRPPFDLNFVPLVPFDLNMVFFNIIFYCDFFDTQQAYLRMKFLIWPQFWPLFDHKRPLFDLKWPLCLTPMSNMSFQKFFFKTFFLLAFIWYVTRLLLKLIFDLHFGLHFGLHWPLKSSNGL